MPPIQVFVGLDAIRASAVEVPGLPTQAELKDWLAEHDRIERETEVFDSGELKKLRKLTRGRLLLCPATTPGHARTHAPCLHSCRAAQPLPSGHRSYRTYINDYLRIG